MVETLNISLPFWHVLIQCTFFVLAISITINKETHAIETMCHYSLFAGTGRIGRMNLNILRLDTLYMQSNTDKKTMAAEKMIKISQVTYDRLKDYGKFRDTFDEVIARVLDENDRYRQDEMRRSLPKPPSARDFKKE